VASEGIGFFAPSLAFAMLAFEVFVTPGSRTLWKVSEILSWPSAPLQSLDHPGAAAGGGLPHERLPPMRFFAPSAFFRNRAATYVLMATNHQVMVPSQRFSRSQGFDPPGTYWPCFMPVPPLGFPLPFRADFHSQSGEPSRTPLPSCGSPGAASAPSAQGPRTPGKVRDKELVS